MTNTILLTAAQEDTEEIIDRLSDNDFNILHTPLEIYTERTDEETISSTPENLDDFENIVYGSIRNARFFLNKVKRLNKMDSVKERLNLAFDESTFDYLEQEGVAAIHPQNGNNAIDLVELMLRLQRLGATLYPCGSHRREDFPGLLQELDIDVMELDIFDLEGPSEERLAGYKKEMAGLQAEAVIFHSRRSVNRTLAAFPDLDYDSLKVISADTGITKKLEYKNIAVDAEGEGSWASVVEILQKA
jgi:uroporphyrinogen-III synthase